MLNLFKSTKIGFWISAIALVAWITRNALKNYEVYAAISPSFLWQNLVFAIVFWGLMVWCIWTIIASKKLNKLIIPIFNNCNYHKLIDISSNFLQKKHIKSAKNILLLNLASGYLCVGNAKAAKQTLDCIGGFKNNRSGISHQFLYYSNLFAYFELINDIPNAAQTLGMMRRISQEKKIFKKARKSYIMICNSAQLQINMSCGNYNGAEEHFRVALDLEKHVIGKVIANFHLGRVYMHYNKLIEAKEAFEYVAANGGDTYYVDRAQNFLERIREMA